MNKDFGYLDLRSFTHRTHQTNLSGLDADSKLTLKYGLLLCPMGVLCADPNKPSKNSKTDLKHHVKTHKTNLRSGVLYRTEWSIRIYLNQHI